MNPEAPDHLARLTQVFQKAQPTLPRQAQDALLDFLKFAIARHTHSESQILQDLFALYVMREKRGGYFIDFGATNGLSLSNSYVLEKRYGWNGIVAEPARCWHAGLTANRTCARDFRCVWSESGQTLAFNETTTPEYSTIDAFTNADWNAPGRVNGNIYPVETVSLNDLASTHGAPAEIDYLSLDTEGSELAILKAFDFTRTRVKIITVEHNFTEPARREIYTLLLSNGFVRVFEPFSGWDDWYVHSTVLAQSPLANYPTG